MVPKFTIIKGIFSNGIKKKKRERVRERGESCKKIFSFILIVLLAFKMME